MNAKEKAISVAKIIDAKKGHNIKVLCVEELTVITEYFVLATGNSATQVHALADEAIKKMSEAGEPPVKVEGANSRSWVLIDFGGVVLHVFDRESRDFYGLDSLWGDAEMIEIPELIKE